MASNVVTGPLAIVRDDTGKLRYYYQGAVLPKDLPKHEIDRLVKAGLVGQEKELVAQADSDEPSTSVSSAPPVPEPASAPASGRSKS